MTDLLSRFKTFISEKKLFVATDHLLLAVSGGVDSVVLCELCSKSGFEFTIAHVNFSLRGAESDRDQQFVEILAAKYQQKILQKRFDTKSYAETNKCSIQVAARMLRYNWFEELMHEKDGPGFTLTAHHLDDNVETVLMNLFKGTGIAGLHGIQPKHGKLIRPLLFARKEELVHYAEKHSLSWVEDSSNQLDHYSRNFMRQHIIPEIIQLYPEAMTNIAAGIERFTEVEQLYKMAIARQKSKLIVDRAPEFHIAILKLKKATPLKAITFEIISDFGFSPAQVDELIHLMDSESGRYIQSVSHRVVKNRQWLIIAPLQNPAPKTILIEQSSCECDMGMGKFVVSKTAPAPKEAIKLSASNFVALLDANHIHFPLLLRPWKQGDYFYPLGMRKKKKIARFLIDQKLAKTEKEKVWVVEMNKKIVWVVGLRLDDRFKITGSTRELLKLEFRKY